MFFNGNSERKIEHTIPSERALKTELKTGIRIVCGILFDLICSMTSSVSLFLVLMFEEVGPSKRAGPLTLNIT